MRQQWHLLKSLGGGGGCWMRKSCHSAWFRGEGGREAAVVVIVPLPPPVPRGNTDVSSFSNFQGAKALSARRGKTLALEGHGVREKWYKVMQIISAAGSGGKRLVYCRAFFFFGPTWWQGGSDGACWRSRNGKNKKRGRGGGAGLSYRHFVITATSFLNVGQLWVNSLVIHWYSYLIVFILLLAWIILLNSNFI